MGTRPFHPNRAARDQFELKEDAIYQVLFRCAAELDELTDRAFSGAEIKRQSLSTVLQLYRMQFIQNKNDLYDLEDEES